MLVNILRVISIVASQQWYYNIENPHLPPPPHPSLVANNFMGDYLQNKYKFLCLKKNLSQSTYFIKQDVYVH